MPEATFLQIQGGGGSPARVLELPVGPIRVGRGPLCEVRIADARLGEVQCILRRRGDAWHYQPVGPPGLVTIEGRPADRQRALPLGVPVRVGDHWLTLRPAGSAAESFGSFEAPIPVDAEAAETEPAPEPARPEPPRAAPAEGDEDRLRRWQSRVEQRDRWLKDRQDEKRWEARWKAAGETIRARSPVPAPSPPPSRPTPPPTAAPRPAPSPPAARPIDPRPAPSFRRIAEPTPRPTPARVPLKNPPGPFPETPAAAEPDPKVEVGPIPPQSRALVAFPMPPIDWSGARVVADEIGPEPAPIEPEVVAVEVAEPGEIEAEAEEAPAPVMERLGALADPIPEETEPVEEVAEVVSKPIVEPCPEAEVLADPAVEVEVSPTSETGPEPAGWDEVPEDDGQATALVAELAEAVGPVAEPEPIRTASPMAEWPSARAIFAAQGHRTAPAAPEPAAASRKRRAAPTPTDPLAPPCWSIPGWLGAVPAAALALVVGAAGVGLTLEWMADASSAEAAMALASRPEGATARPVDLAALPPRSWWRSTAPHLAAWAMALSRSADGEDHAEEVRSFQDSARHASPLSSTTRFAIEPAAAPPGTGAGDLAHLGRSRDVVTLAWAGRGLRESGKVEASLRAYRSALALAAEARRDELDPPAFDEDPQVRRYRLPREAALASVIQGMARAGDWTVEQWSGALPDSATAPLVASRVLRKAGKAGEADRLADLAISRLDAPIAPGLDPAEHRAAVAEALAYRGRWTDAAGQYRLAIELAADDPTRRRFWLNLAEVAQRVGDDATRARAIESAKAADSSDEITKRALRHQQNNPGLASRGARP